MKTTHLCLACVFAASVVLAQDTQPSMQKTAAVSYDLKQQPGADGKRFGAGLMLGDPFGVSLKYWLAERSAIDGGFGFSSFDGDGFEIHADYLYHIPDIIPMDQGTFLLYFGGGPRFKTRNNRDDQFGLRTIVGLDYVFEDHPVDTFIELGPVFDFTPDFEVRFTAAVGARYWF